MISFECLFHAWLLYSTIKVIPAISENRKTILGFSLCDLGGQIYNNKPMFSKEDFVSGNEALKAVE